VPTREKNFAIEARVKIVRGLMATSKVGWKLKWDPDWQRQPSRRAKKGGEAIIFPGERYPDDHPV
jgi:hypothetical protein